MRRDILPHTLQGPPTLYRCVLSYTVKLMFLLVTPAAVLLAPVASLVAEVEVCGEDAEQSEECIEVTKRRFPQQKRSRRVDFARPSTPAVSTAGAGGPLPKNHGVQTTQMVPLRC